MALLVVSAGCAHRLAPPASAGSPRACFLLTELNVGRTVGAPSEVCSQRFSPASTFKIPHALAVLDAGLASGADERFAYDGSAQPFDAWKRDHTLASAMYHSVLWVFQQIARQLGPEREKAYLEKLDYGNRDISSGLTRFWLGGSLKISPEEQERFLVRLFDESLPVSAASRRAVRQMLLQPRDRVVNAAGEHRFAAPWPPETEVRSKTGRARQDDGTEVRWLVGEVKRRGRRWVFVSCVVGGRDLPALAAVDLAAQELRAASVL
jgi:beta-lactamase class D